MQNDNVKLKKSEPFLELKRKFRKFGSWALWDKDKNYDFDFEDSLEFQIKPHIVFIGLNASKELADKKDWANYHFGSWHYQKLADVILEKEFSYFKGAYMTDIIKTSIDSKSKKVDEILEQDRKNGGNKIKENMDKIEREIELLSSISNKKCLFICIGKCAFKWTKEMIQGDICEVFRYANYGKEEVKKKIRRDLRKIILNFDLPRLCRGFSIESESF